MLQEQNNNNIQAKETTDNYRDLEVNGEVYLSYSTYQSPTRTLMAPIARVSMPTCIAWGTSAIVYLWAHCCVVGTCRPIRVWVPPTLNCQPKSAPSSARTPPVAFWRCHDYHPAPSSHLLSPALTSSVCSQPANTCKWVHYPSETGSWSRTSHLAFEAGS
jgi:hypothetical protein